MQWTAWVGMALTMATVTVGTRGAPPVILELGPVRPTPAPTAKPAEKKRLITTITVQNNPTGESVISFEAMDFADEGSERVGILASQRYSLADDKPELREMTGKIISQIRVLERELLEYVDRAGPPKERAPVGSSSYGGSQPQR